MSDNKKITKQIPAQRTRAQFVASSFNEADRTIDVTFASEASVRMFDWENYEPIDEVLVCTPDAGDLTRLNNGAPALDNHMRYGKTSDAVVGVVTGARFENNTGIAKIRFGSSESDTDLMNKVRDGIVTGVSVGYSVQEYQVVRADGKIPQYRATKWQPTEISFTPVQADINSRVRSEGGEATAVVIEDVTPEAATQNEPSPAEEPIDNNNLNDNTMDNNNPAPAAPAATAEPTTTDAATRAAIASTERARIVGIQSVCRSLGLDAETENGLVNGTLGLEAARSAALDAWQAKQPANANPTVAQVHTDAEATRSAMTNALVLRIDQRAAQVMKPEDREAAAEFKGMSLLRFAEESLIRGGVKTTGMSQREIATAALGGKVRGLHHTTDFPLLLLSTVNRTLLAQYALQARTFMDWARRETINDFRAISRVRLSEILGDLEKVREGEEYKYGTLSEAGETYQLAKYGKIIGITWEAIMNDDLSAFNRIPQAFAVKAAQLQSNLVYNTIMTDGFKNMGDGNPLFSAAHGNFTGTAGNQTAGGTALSEASLTLAYQGFMNQKGADGSFITVAPKHLVVGPKNAFLAMKMTSANYTPNTQANIPVGSLVGLTVIVEPRLTNYEWFLIAHPDMIDTVEYAFLAGEEELFIDQREGFNIDGIEIKARMIFAAKAIDWRGMYRNNGAVPA